MTKLVVLCLSLLLAMMRIEAFSVLPPPSRIAIRSSSMLSLMSQEETETLLGQASDCAEGECSLDEVADLITLLKGQQKELAARVDSIKKMITDLEKVNTKGDERKVDEVRETIRALYRVFQLGDKASGNDYPKLSKPMGWTGEVGDGPKTAYDALPPKPYKSSKK